MTEKVVFFLDYANINRAAREERYRLDYQDLLNYVGEGRCLLDAHCYVPINPRNEHRLDGAIEELWRAGYLVTTKMGHYRSESDPADKPWPWAAAGHSAGAGFQTYPVRIYL
jgi:hypothetical protein